MFLDIYVFVFFRKRYGIIINEYNNKYISNTILNMSAITVPITTRASTVPTTTRIQPPPAVTMGATTTGTTTMNTSAGSCDIAIPDYTTLRQQNLDKINEYYNTLLSSYTQSYRDFTTQSASSNVNDRTYANTTLKPKVQNYNTQIINVSQSMIDNVDQDTDLIMQQKDQLLEKTNQIDTIMNNIKLLKEKDNEMNILVRARNDSLNSSKTGTDDMSFYTYIYIGINILMVLCIIGIVIYIVYSNYSGGYGMNSTRMNNAHRLIARN